MATTNTNTTDTDTNTNESPEHTERRAIMAGMGFTDAQITVALAAAAASATLTDAQAAHVANKAAAAAEKAIKDAPDPLALAASAARSAYVALGKVRADATDEDRGKARTALTEAVAALRAQIGDEPNCGDLVVAMCEARVTRTRGAAPTGPVNVTEAMQRRADALYALGKTKGSKRVLDAAGLKKAHADNLISDKYLTNSGMWGRSKPIGHALRAAAGKRWAVTVASKGGDVVSITWLAAPEQAEDSAAA